MEDRQRIVSDEEVRIPDHVQTIALVFVFFDPLLGVLNISQN